MTFKLPAPNYTQVPNIFLDEWLPKLTPVETKVLFVIMRKTFGWHKIRDQISLSQLEKSTGSLRQAILKATKSLQEKNLISKVVVGEKSDQKTFYELVVSEDSNNFTQCDEHTPPSVFNTPPPSVFNTPTKEIPIPKGIGLKKGGEAAPPSTPPNIPPIFERGKVRMFLHSYKELIEKFGEEAVDYTIKQLDLFSEIDPARFKRYKSHAAVIDSWINRDSKGKNKPKIKESNPWTKRYITNTTESNANSSGKDTPEPTSPKSLMDLLMESESPTT